MKLAPETPAQWPPKTDLLAEQPEPVKDGHLELPPESQNTYTSVAPQAIVVDDRFGHETKIFLPPEGSKH